MNSTSIEWCNRPETRGVAGAKTWNPIRARAKSIIDRRRPSGGTFCTKISPGCTHCYASTINKRFGNGLEFTVPNLEKIEFFIDQRILEEPLKEKKPCTIFAGDMNDVFHESVTDELIDRTLAVAALCDWHTFQFLTKRAERMRAYFSARETPFRIQQQIDAIIVDREMASVQEFYISIPGYKGHYEISTHGNVRSKTGRPLSPIADGKGYFRVALSKDGIVRQFFIHRLVLLAFTGESEQECRHRNGTGTDNRIANVRYCDHAENVADRSRHGQSGVWMKEEAPLSDAEVEQIRKRRASGELLKSIEADTGVDRRKVSQIARGKTYKLAALDWPLPNIWLGVSVEDKQRAEERIPFLQATPAAVRFLSVEPQLEEVQPDLRGISWVICGGESGPGARPFNLAWAESLLFQCRAANVPFFMKQIGSKPIVPGLNVFNRRDRKGGDPSKWPHGFRVREFPQPGAVREPVSA